jgi:hypothetical protein
MISKTLLALLSLALLLMAVLQPAAAYVDPGSGAMLWQLAAAAVVGCLFRIKRIACWFRARFAKRETA